MKTTTTMALLALLAAGPALAADGDLQRFQELHGIDHSALQGASVPTRAALQALGVFGLRADISGRGDADYWVRSYSLLERSTRAFGRGIGLAGNPLPPGPLKSFLRSLGNELASIDYSGRGDADFWMARSEQLSDRTRSAGRQLLDMREVAEGPLPLRPALFALAEVAGGVTDGGRGDVQYWMRTAEMLGRHGHRVGEALGSLRDATSGATRRLLSSLARQFSSLDASGRGDVHYWMAKADGLEDQIRSLSQILRDTASSL